MIGISSNFSCPCCEKKYIIDLGITSFVNYKGDRLALRNCLYCDNEIAFEIVEPQLKIKPPARYQLNDFASEIYEKINDIVNSLYDENKSEDDMINIVLSELKITLKYNKTELNEFFSKDIEDLKKLVQIALSNNLDNYGKSFEFNKIKNECKAAGCICY